MSLEFLLTAMVVVLLPGTGVIYTIAIGLGRGFIPSVAAAVGCTLGIVPAALAGILGLAAILHTSALAFQFVKFAGVAYLFYMAWGILKSGGTLDVSEDQEPRSLLQTAVSGTLLNILNPKLSLFFMAFLPQFVTAGGSSVVLDMILLAAIFMLLTLIIFIGYGACASAARDYVISKPSVMRWLRRSFAATFATLGLKLALSER